MPETRYGYCECGCGEKTTVPDRNYAREGRVKGRPVRFRQGHNSRVSHPAQKDGPRKCGRYLILQVPDHPFCQEDGYVYAHRLVAERAVGRPLHTRHPVHHVNGDGRDNRPENLVVCEDTAYHSLLHARARAMQEAGDPNARRCWLCHSWSVAGEDFTITEGGSAYHKSCAALYVRLQRRMPAKEARLRVRGEAA